MCETEGCVVCLDQAWAMCQSSGCMQKLAPAHHLHGVTVVHDFDVGAGGLQLPIPKVALVAISNLHKCCMQRFNSRNLLRSCTTPQQLSTPVQCWHVCACGTCWAQRGCQGTTAVSLQLCPGTWMGLCLVPEHVANSSGQSNPV